MLLVKNKKVWYLVPLVSTETGTLGYLDTILILTIHRSPRLTFLLLLALAICYLAASALEQAESNSHNVESTVSCFAVVVYHYGPGSIVSL